MIVVMAYGYARRAGEPSRDLNAAAAGSPDRQRAMGFSGAGGMLGGRALDSKTDYHGAFADSTSFAKKVHLLWRRAGMLMQAVAGGRPGADVIARGGNNTWAPDVIRVGDKFFVYYAAPGTQPKAAIGLLVGRTLDPESPDYKWEDSGPVVWSDGVEDSDAVDPGVLLDPTNGSLWFTYGPNFGYIRLVELDPTGSSISTMACRNSPATTKRTWIAAASACWTSGRCCGATVGQSLERISSKARTRSSPRARARALELADGSDRGAIVAVHAAGAAEVDHRARG
jgi:hypothetical protein